MCPSVTRPLSFTCAGADDSHGLLPDATRLHLDGEPRVEVEPRCASKTQHHDAALASAIGLGQVLRRQDTDRRGFHA